MGTFALQYDDDESDVGVSDHHDVSAMDVDGDSFQKQIDGATRVQSDPDWQAQQQHNNQYTQQQTAEQAELAYSPDQQNEYNFRPTQPMSSRPRYHLTSPNHDQHMLYADVPSSTGKRKRAESQPPARNTYNPEPDTANHPALRRFGGMVVVMCTIGVSILSSAWNFVTGWATAAPAPDAQEAEIIAIETDTSGRKRRAIPSGSFPNLSESPRSQGSNSPTSPGKEPITESSDAREAVSDSTLPRSQGSESSTSAAKEPINNTRDGAGAFPYQTLPTPERSQSPLRKQSTRRPRRRYGETGATQQRYLEPMPNLTEYTVDSIEPTLAEMKEKCKNKHHPTEYDWEEARKEKKKQRTIRDAEELRQWAERMDELKRDEEEAFWEQERNSQEGARMQAKYNVIKVKFGEDWMNENLEFHESHHQIFHTLGKCEESREHYKFHELDMLQCHETAKVVEAEVANDTKLSPEQQRAFLRTSANRKFSMKTKKAETKPAMPLQQGKHPTSVALAKKDGNGQKEGGTAVEEGMIKAAGMTEDAGTNKEAGTTKEDEEERRPTTSSSHKPASYKGGLAPTPRKNDAGADPEKKWSYDKNMVTGKSVLKTKSQHELKDQRIDGLINRANRVKQAQVQSPQDQRFKSFVESRRVRNREKWNKDKAAKDEGKEITRRKAEMERQVAEREVEEVREGWEKLRVEEEEEKKKRAEEEEAERAAAEEAAKLKGEKEAEEARKAEEVEKAAAAEAERATKQILIRPLDPKWVDRVQKTMNHKDRDTVVATSMDGTELRRHDFGSLLPQEGTSDDQSGWLNDEIVNGFITAIVTRKQEQVNYKKGPNSVPPFEAYNSAWYTTYEKQGIHAIQRWSRRKGISGAKLLKAEKIFFPINVGGHWQLTIISPQEKDIEFLDSLRRKPEKHFKAAREWLAMELGEKLYEADEWTETHGRSNRQGNVNDCGVFVVMNSLAAAKGYPFTDVSMPKMPDARRMVAAVLVNGGLFGDWEL